MSDDRVSVVQAAEILGVHPQRVHQRIRDGSLPAEKVGSQWVIERHELRRIKHRAGPGRPLSPKSAWDLLVVAANGQAASFPTSAVTNASTCRVSRIPSRGCPVATSPKGVHLPTTSMLSSTTTCSPQPRPRANVIVHVVPAHLQHPALAAGLSQRDIALAIGRSQPEVSRLLRFHGSTPLGRRLRSARQQVIALIAAAGGEDVRVFGSVAAGEDSEGSDIDLLFSMTRPLGLLELEALQSEVSKAVGAPVDLVPDDTLLPPVARRVRREAVAL